MTDPNKFIQYRVRKVERYIVTRYESKGDGSASTNDVRQIGNEFANPDTAYEVGCALARQEAELKGIRPHDPAMRYPQRPSEDEEARDADPANSFYAAVSASGRVTQYPV